MEDAGRVSVSSVADTEVHSETDAVPLRLLCRDDLQCVVPMDFSATCLVLVHSSSLRAESIPTDGSATVSYRDHSRDHANSGLVRQTSQRMRVQGLHVRRVCEIIVQQSMQHDVGARKAANGPAKLDRRTWGHLLDAERAV
jgi:hypothetical protein